MGWEKRERGGLYYTRTRKVGGRVVREYVGGGILGHVAALQDAQERRRREEEAAWWREERDRLEALIAPVDQLCEVTEILYRATLLATGFRRHQRGEWRRKREPKNSLDNWQPAEGPSAPDLANKSKGAVEKPGKTVETLHDLLRLAEKGEEDAVPEIRRILNENPDLAWEFVDLAKVAEDALIEDMTREQDLATRELMRCQLEAMKEQIAGNEYSPLERLLSERVVVTWLEVQLFEALYVRNMRNLSITQADYHQKRLDRAHRRHLSAIRALAQIRKLLKGTTITQINIADKQINTTS